MVEREGGWLVNAYLKVSIFRQDRNGTTLRVPRDGRGYEPDKYIASFIAGAPAESPQICGLVMVREPNRRLGLWLFRWARGGAAG